MTEAKQIQGRDINGIFKEKDMRLVTTIDDIKDEYKKVFD